MLLARDGISQHVAAHPDGAVLVAACDGVRLVTGGDDGRVVATGADGSIKSVAEAKGWIDALALHPNGAVAFGASWPALAVSST